MLQSFTTSEATKTNDRNRKIYTYSQILKIVDLFFFNIYIYIF